MRRIALTLVVTVTVAPLTACASAGSTDPGCGECVEELAPQAHTAGIALTVEYGDGPFELQSSAADLRRVLTNLVSNAVKFTPPHGQVWVGCSATADGLLLTVSDNGIGIPPGELEKVFDRFFRSASAESLAGTGESSGQDHEPGIQQHDRAAQPQAQGPRALCPYAAGERVAVDGAGEVGGAERGVAAR